MSSNLNFNRQMLDSLLGGLSAVDFPQLRIKNLDQAYRFIRAYGYDIEDETELNQLWSYHSRAVTYIRSRILLESESLPENLVDANKLNDLRYLLIYASTKDNKENSLQSWSCAILRVMHVIIHLEKDLFSQFSEEIQLQILKPFKDHIVTDPMSGPSIQHSQTLEKIKIKRFDTKSFKKSDSSITKLLIKPQAVVFRILDKVGVRIITKSIFDIFTVMRYLVENGIVNVANVIPQESTNTIFPVENFLRGIESLSSSQKLSGQDIDKILFEKFKPDIKSNSNSKKYNEFSDINYRFIKFISRKLIKIKSKDDKPLSFFYPFEVQILDYQTYVNNLSGSTHHDEYKKRQYVKARMRVLNLV